MRSDAKSGNNLPLPSPARPPENEQSNRIAQAELAESLGYASYLELIESSKKAAVIQDVHCVVSAAMDGTWVLWTDLDYKIKGRFNSRQAALVAGTVSPQ